MSEKKIIGLFGVGQTDICIYVASILQNMGYRVCVVDNSYEQAMYYCIPHPAEKLLTITYKKIDYERLEKMVESVGKEHLVLDLSCRKKEDTYYIVTDRWQKYTDVVLNGETLHELSSCCDEFLIHAVDVEGKAKGIEEEVAALLGRECEIPVTYAGGVHSFEDLKKLKELGNNRVDVTIGSALDLFGGNMKFEEVLAYMER